MTREAIVRDALNAKLRDAGKPELNSTEPDVDEVEDDETGTRTG